VGAHRIEGCIGENRCGPIIVIIDSSFERDREGRTGKKKKRNVEEKKSSSNKPEENGKSCSYSLSSNIKEE